MFLTIEFVMRPRKYNFFNLFNEDMHSYAVFSYFNMICSQTVLCCGHLLISANRLTAFYKPLTHEEIWSTKHTLLAVLFMWILSIISALPFLFIFPESIRFYLMKKGIVQLFAGGFATLYDTIQSVVINTTVVLFCSVSYVCCFMMARKTVGRNASIEHNLLICAATSAFPFFIEFIRAIAGVFSSFNGLSELYVLLTELWFYEIEVVASLPMWLQVIVNKSLRDCLLAEFSKLRKRSTPSTILPDRGCGVSSNMVTIYSR
ncbi:hypothetical protein Y032_0225g2766 [Ancylostoma ceylanicum]|nr:hypothetical protein Y032_0225g2766 [Ancylostoma ceylanicum]